MSLYHVNGVYREACVCTYVRWLPLSLSLSPALASIRARVFHYWHRRGTHERRRRENAKGRSQWCIWNWIQVFQLCLLSPAYFAQFLCVAQQTRRHRRARGGRHGLSPAALANCLSACSTRSVPIKTEVSPLSNKVWYNPPVWRFSRLRSWAVEVHQQNIASDRAWADGFMCETPFVIYIYIWAVCAKIGYCLMESV